MITRRQFLKGCLGAIATISGISILSDYKEIDKLINSIPILLYHRVGSEPDDLTISVKHFQQDMELLSYGGYNTLSLEQVKQHFQVNRLSSLLMMAIWIIIQMLFLFCKSTPWWLVFISLQEWLETMIV